jgi:hypothetical protein
MRCKPAESLSESMSALIAATSKATLGTLNNSKGDENISSASGQTINHLQPSEDRHVDEGVVMSDIGPVPQTLCTKSKTMRRSSSSSVEKRLADKTRWGHFNPRTQWHEWQEVICDEDMDAVLAARRARNRQLGKWLEKCYPRGLS